MPIAAAHPVRSAPRQISRPGVTFLEVVLAMALLGLAAATIANVLGFITAMQRRQQTTLGCAEVANRLILQHLLNPEKLPARGLPIEYLADDYRWDIQVDPIEYELSPEVELALDEGGAPRTTSPMSIDNRLERIAVTVWLSDESGGSRQRDDGAPQVSLIRVVDRLNLSRNPAIARGFGQDGDQGIQRFIDLVTGGGGLPSAPATPATNQNNRESQR